MSLKKKRKTALRFLLFAAVLQIALVLVCTCGALEQLLPVYVRAVSDKVTLGDDSYTDFFPIRQYMAEYPVDVIVIGVDFSYTETYSLLNDLIVSMKNDVNIGTVCIDAYPGTMGNLSALISAKEEDTRQNIIRQLKERQHCSDAFCEFALNLSRMKEEYPPQRQYSGGTAIAGEDGASLQKQLVASAAAYQNKTGRPVLILTDSDNLRVNAELRTILRESTDLSSMCIQCHYSSEEKPYREIQPEVKILEQEKMHIFDEFYSGAAKRADGHYPGFRFSEIYTTEISFLMYNCTPAETAGSEGT